jgi:hypothetical protein
LKLNPEKLSNTSVKPDFRARILTFKYFKLQTISFKLPLMGLGEDPEAQPSPTAAGLKTAFKLSPELQVWLDRTTSISEF